MNLHINRFTSEEFRAKRYEDADDIPPLTSHPAKNRRTVGEIEAAWTSTGWSDPCQGIGASNGLVKRQEINLYLYKIGEAIGRAKFMVYWFQLDAETISFVYAADNISQELYNFAASSMAAIEALAKTSDQFIGEEDGFYLCGGMRIVEFNTLVMREGHASGSEWVPAIKEFIGRKFKSTKIRWYYALILNAFPLEYGVDDESLEPPATKRVDSLQHRRLAMVRHYKRTLGVELLTKCDMFGTDEWWMGREL